MGSDLLRDTQLAWRSVVRTPSVTVPVVAALALGFALLATTIVIVNAYLLRSLPYPAAERLYHVVYAPVGTPEPRGLSALDWRALRDVVEFADSSAGARFVVPTGNTTDEVLGLLAVPGTLEAFGARVTLGRGFSLDDFRSGERVAAVSESFWRSRLGGDSTAVGRMILAGPASGTSPPIGYRVIAVLGGEWRDPRAFGRGVVDMVVPNLTPSRTYVVRLREGVSAVAAERRLTDAVREMASSLPDAWQGVKLESLHGRYVRDMRPVLLSVAIAAILVFLIVCANVAVLQLLRALRRQREMAVRVALGAGTGHILRLLVIESAILCTFALTVALVVSATAMSAIAPAIEAALGRPVPHGLAAVRIDPTVAALVAAFGAAATLLLSAVPLLAPLQRRLSRTLRDGGRGATDAGAMRRVRTGLVTAQLAVSVALVVGCGLTIRSALHLVRADLGIETEGVFRARVTPPRLGYEDPVARSRFYDALVSAMARRSSEPIALSSFPVLIPANPVTVETEGGRAVTTSSMAVTASFFSILGMRIEQGRAFTDADRPGSEPVVIVSESFARRVFPGTVAVGRRISAVEVEGETTGVWRTIVGIANDVRQDHADDDRSDVYVPFFQQAGMFTSVYVRTAAPYGDWLESLGESAREIDPRVVVRATSSLAVEAERHLAGPKFLASVLTGFALVAACLTMLGVYAVVAYAVQQRTREMAIRGALGATPQMLLGVFLREGAPVVVMGCALGTVGALGVGRVLGSQLHGIAPFDLTTMVAGSVLIGLGAMIFTWAPARRAAMISPSIALNDN